MFAPLVARAQKAVANPISGMAPQRSRPFGDNTAANLTNGEKPRGVSWDLSKIAVFPPDPADAPAPTVARLPGVIQPKLVVGQVDDPLEHEADRVAEQVMRDPGQAVSLTAASPQLSRKCAACEEEENSLRMKPARSDASGAPAPALVHEVLSSPGRSLDAPTRAFFEPRFGHDFGAVRIYDDGQAAASARSMGALAYTVGRDIVFGRGEYAAGTDSGRRLLAHELAHVMQQAGTTQYLRRVPCRSAAQCAAPAPGDPGTASTNVEKERQDRDAALAAAPLGSAAAAKKARLGERAAHLENSTHRPRKPAAAGGRWIFCRSRETSQLVGDSSMPILPRRKPRHAADARRQILCPGSGRSRGQSKKHRHQYSAFGQTARGSGCAACYRIARNAAREF